jgi:hypothetical protein
MPNIYVTTHKHRKNKYQINLKKTQKKVSPSHPPKKVHPI